MAISKELKELIQVHHNRGIDPKDIFLFIAKKFSIRSIDRRIKKLSNGY